MRILSLIFTLVLFVVALGFALSNTQLTDLRFFLSGDQALVTLPLVVLLLGFFIIGVALGMLAGLPSWLRQRREIARLRKALRKRDEAEALSREEARVAEALAAPAPSASQPAAKALVDSRAPAPQLGHR